MRAAIFEALKVNSCLSCLIWIEMRMRLVTLKVCKVDTCLEYEN